MLQIEKRIGNFCLIMQLNVNEEKGGFMMMELKVS
jgi:hypothetical protein